MKKSLTLEEYRQKYRTPLTVIAARSGISFNQIYHIVRGGCPKLKAAIALQKYTNGEITCEKLLPIEILKEIEKNQYEN